MPRLVFAMLFAAVYAAVLAAGAMPAGAQDESAADQEPARTYTVELRGVEDDDLVETIREIADLYTQQDDPPATLVGLRRRMSEDRELIRRFLRNEGYYAVELAVRLDSAAAPAEVTIDVTLGPAYTLSNVAFEPAEQGESLPAGLSAEAVGLEIGARSRAADILDAQSKVPAALALNGHPFADVARRRVVVDHRARGVSVTFWVEAGPAARFGETRITGLDRLNAGFVRRRIEWTAGETYSPAPLRKTRDALLATELFSSVRIEPVPPVDPEGRVQIRITVTERKPRTIAFGGYFSTSLGPGGNASWTHRNLFGNAERLRLSAEAALAEQSFLAEFRRPDLFQGPQTLILTGRFDERRLDAFDSRELRLGADIERVLRPGLTVTGGLTFERSRIMEDGMTERFVLYGAPLRLRYDGSDSLLNPTEGFRVDVNVTPYTGSGLFFTRSVVFGRAYYTPLSDVDLTFAGWARYGVILGEERADIPANKRLYAGGGGSVRGFGFQRIGPLDASNDPIGGRSLVEVGVEARFPVTGNWGGVVFIEAGDVYEEITPRFDRPLRVGAGLGVRYLTSLGPLRLDLAFPLNRREGDMAFQVYISIGQAF